MKWEKVSQYIYKSGDWKVFGQVSKQNPTRTPKVTYFVKYQGNICQNFPGGSLIEAKRFTQLSGGRQ